MATNNLRFAEGDWTQLRRIAAPSFHPGAAEAGAIGLVGKFEYRGRREYLVSRMLWPQAGEVKEADNHALVFDASYIRRAHLEMRKHKLAGLAFFHSHPRADLRVGFSDYDDFEEPKLVENLREIESSTAVISVVLGKRSQCGRVWDLGRSHEALKTLIVVGEALREYPLDGSAAAASPRPSEVFSRGNVLTGAGALALLSRMTIAVIGASGTGSLVCELLARAGCRRILLVDFDISKTVNLNRVLHMKVADANAGTPKVEVLKREIEALGLGCEVVCIHGNVLDRDILKQLRDADVLFGCVDAALPRELLCRFAFQYLRPYIDVGSEIGGDEVAGIAAINARANYVAPGRRCLQCAGIVTSRALRHESLSAAERKRVVAQGYSEDLLLEAPAVMDLNMHAAGYGMMLLRHILQPVLSLPLPVTISENLLTYRTVAPDRARAENPKCPICKANANIGRGDCGFSLGFDAAAVKTITG